MLFKGKIETFSSFCIVFYFENKIDTKIINIQGLNGACLILHFISFSASHLTFHLSLPVEHQVSMSPSLARSAPSELNHWWSQLRFRLQNKKGWNEMLDETFLLHTK